MFEAVRCRFEVSSAVGFATVFYGGDVEGVAVVVEAEAVVSDAEAELGRFDVLKAFYIALAGAGEVVQCAENA